MPYRFHILGIPHTASNALHVSCAYTQKIVKLCAMLKAKGHTVIHYGNELSEVACDEHVTVTSADDLAQQYGDRWMTEFYTFDMADPVYRKFYANAIEEIGKRKQPRDFLLCMWGAGHKAVADAHPDMIAVEPGIGYAGGHFAKWRVWESYAIMHAYFGMERVGSAKQNEHWYDVVIPNYFDPDDFTYPNYSNEGLMNPMTGQLSKAPPNWGYILFLGRMVEGKGLHIAIEVARATKTKLKIAGPGRWSDFAHLVQPGDDIEYVGFADKEMRRDLLSRAKALIAPSLFVEPFCGVTIEASMSGTPVIVPDWGAPTETVKHGVTGFRCRTFDQFCWAVRNIDRIRSEDCRAHAIKNYSMDRVAEQYEEFWSMVMDVHTGNGWYFEHPERRQLNLITAA